MNRLTATISIGSYEFKNINQVSIKSSWEMLTDSAEITIPKKVEFEGKEIATDGGIFAVGDKVEINLGYDFDESLIFSGYLVKIMPGKPIKILCEDEMYHLKKGAISKSFKSVNLSTLLSEFVDPGALGEVVDADLGQFRIINSTGAQVLKELEKTYSIKSWFRDGKLYCGLAYWKSLQNPEIPVFDFNYNIVKSNLTWQNEGDVKIKVKAISMNPDNTKTTVEVGDPDGDLRTLNYYNKSESELKAAAERDIQNFRFTGYRGDLTTFGDPVVKHGDIIRLVDSANPDRAGDYLVKEVVTEFGGSGYRQSFKLDAQI